MKLNTKLGLPHDIGFFIYFPVDKRKWQITIDSHTSGRIGVRTSITTSSLAILIFLSVELELMDCHMT